jgi:hypothetical protein
MAVSWQRGGRQRPDLAGEQKISLQKKNVYIFEKRK